VEPSLEQAAAHITAVVEAECPANHPTLKGLIHDDVDKTTEELRRRVQSLEAKLGETNAMKGKGAKNERGGDKKSKTTSGTVVAPSTVTPKSKNRKATTKTKRKKNPATKDSPASPAGNDNAFNAARKKSRKKATTRKSGGKGRGKPAAARN